MLDNYRFARAKYEEFKAEPPPPPRLITGDDLIGMGYPPGPIFSRILEAVEDLHLEEPRLTREQALAYVRRKFPLHGIRANPMTDADWFDIRNEVEVSAEGEPAPAPGTPVDLRRRCDGRTPIAGAARPRQGCCAQYPRIRFLQPELPDPAAPAVTGSSNLPRRT